MSNSTLTVDYNDCWPTETPKHEQTEYFLTVQDIDGSHPQDIEISRDEYIWLKQELAKRRKAAAVNAAS